MIIFSVINTVSDIHSFRIEYGMKCTREHEKIIFDIRLISDSRKAILRNQSFKLSFDKYSLVHTFRIYSNCTVLFRSKGFPPVQRLPWYELNTAAESVAKREIFNFRNLEFSDPLLGTCNHYSYNTLPKLYNFLPSFPR